MGINWQEILLLKKHSFNRPLSHLQLNAYINISHFKFMLNTTCELLSLYLLWSG